MDFPTLANGFLENGISQGVKRQRFQNLLGATLQMIGAGPVQALEISGDAITPAAGASGSILLDTEGGGASDDLKNISTANLPDGAFALLRIADNGRPIKVWHNAGGAGQIDLAGDFDLDLNRIEQELWLRRFGANWREIARFGREKDHTDAELALSANWSNVPPFTWWKDNEGVVRISGVLSHSLGIAANTYNTAVLTGIPVGYRPKSSLLRACIYSATGTPPITNGVLHATPAGGLFLTTLGTALPAAGSLYIDLAYPAH